MILRKGACSAQQGETLLIPVNMRDGSLICRGKGNPDWNFSAPHGAGRLFSRSAAKESFTVSASLFHCACTGIDDIRHINNVAMIYFKVPIVLININNN